MIQLINNVNLIGDLVNTVPVMIDLSKKHGGLKVFQTMDEGKWVYPLIQHHGIELVDSIEEIKGYTTQTILSAAFRFSSNTGLHMSQCHHHLFDLKTPKEPVRPDLLVPDIDVPVYDYIFAPFGRSVGDKEKWSLDNWATLAGRLNLLGYSVAVFGNSKHDIKYDFNTNFSLPECQKELPNFHCYDRPMVEVLNMIKKCSKGVVSIVTGISHLCYAMDAKNYLLTGQGTKGWGINPTAKCLSGKVCDFIVDEVLEFVTK